MKAAREQAAQLQQATGSLRQAKDTAEKAAKDAAAQLAGERTAREALERALAEAKKPQ